MRRQEPDQTRDLAALVVHRRAPVPESVRKSRAPFRAARAFERLLRRAHGLARLGELVARRVDGPHERREVVAHLLEPFPERALEAVVAAAPPSPSREGPRAVREGAQDDVQVPFDEPRAVLGAHELVLDVADLAHRAAQALRGGPSGCRREEAGCEVVRAFLCARLQLFFLCTRRGRSAALLREGPSHDGRWLPHHHNS